MGVKIDFDAAGSPMGIEITSPESISAAELNAVLTRLEQPELLSDEWAPLRAA
jgi:hypothetical protein